MTDRPSILVVDDDPKNLLAFRTILGSLNLNVHCVDSGAEALRCLLDREYAMVILDVRMPEMDGFEVAELMAQREQSMRTPILFLSAYEADSEQIQRARRLNPVDYLVKPISSERLRENVASTLGLSA